MSHRLIQLSLTGTGDVREELAALEHVREVWTLGADKTSSAYTMLVNADRVESITDLMQTLYSPTQIRRIVVLPVEAVLPRDPKKPKESPPHPVRRSLLAGVSREELYEDVAAGARLDRNFLTLVLLSTVVAAIGLLENNVAVVIGAMVIAPLLGPNLALALATALGDVDLMRRALMTNLAGVGLTLLLAVILGLAWQGRTDSAELMSRTEVNYGGVVLAIASGAAAALSLASGVALALVGVMVAVALMPPAVTLGLMLGAGNYPLAAGAGLLLATNVVSVNLAANAILWLRGVQPRSWSERGHARRAMIGFTSAWGIALIVVLLLITDRLF